MDAAIDSKQSELAAAGITYTGDVANGTLSFTRADGGNIVFTNTIAGTVGTAGFANNTFAATGTDRGFGDVTLTSDFEIVLGTSGGTIANAGTTAQTVSSGTATGTALTSIDLQNAGNSQTALTSIDSALNTVNLARSNIGAEYSRLDSVSSNLASTVENYSAARSRIQDADFAVESANLARTQVLQQAGISVLAQANALPQQVLALLQ
jgi:flagellin